MRRPADIDLSAGESGVRPAGIRQRRIADALEQALRLHAGKGGRLDVPTLAEAAEMSPRAVRAAMDPGESRREPRLGDGLVLLHVLGPAVLNEMLAVIGYGGAYRLDDEDDPCPHRTAAELGEGLQYLLEGLRNGGRIYPSEAPRIAAELREAGSACFSFADELDGLGS